MPMKSPTKKETPALRTPESTNSGRDKTTDSADLHYFIKQAFVRRRGGLSQVTLKICLVYNILALMVLPVVGKPSIVGYFLLMHVILFALGLLTLVYKNKIKSLAPNVIPVLLLSPALINFYAAYYHIAENDQIRTIMGASTAIICGGAMCFLDPRDGVKRGISALLCIVVGFLAFAESPAGPLLAVVNLAAVGGGFMVTLIHDRDFRIMTEREYKLLIQAAPAKIVRQSALSNADIDQVFSPQNRYCVCLSSDWRDYQTVSSSMTANGLATALGAYYDMCEELLEQIFPEGNYYSDWIADEFFLVVFAKDDLEERNIVNLTLNFGAELIEAKKKFHLTYGVPKAIDIGVSSGPALIGMMGPEGHRKATALGEVPGQSRRLQALGKVIRQTRGDVDRIIFAAETLMDITVALDVEEFLLEDKSQLRNLDADKVYYLESNRDKLKISA
jgi:class 3 adenylate cyclase